MVALAKLFSDKILQNIFVRPVPELLRLIVLTIFVLLKRCRRLSSSHKFRVIVNKKSAKFAYRKMAPRRPGLEGCSVCLSEFGEKDEVRELVECKHVFHSHCLERWLRGLYGLPTCPLCRSVVVPAVVVEEYHRMRIEQQDDGVEKELALILFKALHGGSCYALF